MKSSAQFPGGFCVLMALYGRDKPYLFEKAVHSVFANSLLPNQCLIVVDGPISATLQELAVKLEEQHSAIEYIRLPKNVGLANALNEGLKHIRYSWVVRADSDDMNLPNRFEVLAKVLQEQPDLQLFSSAILEIDEKGNALTVREVPCTESEIREFVKTRSPFNHMAVAYRLDAALACGGYPNIYLKEDYGLWCLFLDRHLPVANIKDVLVHASAGMGMFRRRGGWRYARSEWQMQGLLVKSGLKSSLSAFGVGLLRAIFFLIPASVRGFLYIHLLRKSAK
jgi:glycosyltransferase involved in cell wall biosynthesis